MPRQAFYYSDLTYASGVDSSSTTVAAIAAPPVGSQIVLHWLKLNTKTADTIQTMSNATVMDTNYLGANSGIVIDYGNKPLELGGNNPLNFTKQATTIFSFAAQYEIVSLT